MATRDYRTIPSTTPLAYAALPQGQRPAWLGSAEMDQYQSGGAPPSGGLADMLLNQNQGLTSIDANGYAIRGSEPTIGDRVWRTIDGLATGYDAGSGWKNAGIQLAAGALGPVGRGFNSAAGAYQGATSDDLVFRKELPKSTLGAPDINQPDVMPRGIYGGGLLDPNAGSRDALDYSVGGTPPVNSPLQSGTGGATQGFAQNPIASRPTVAGQTRPTTGFTGGSGAMVDPYALPAEDTLLELLANAQRYSDYDAGTGRIGRAGAASGAGGYQFSGFDFAQDAGNRDIGKSAKYAFSYFADEAAKRGDPQPRTKAEAEAWFTRNIAPGLQAAGYEIDWVQGDKARIKTREGWDEIDFLGNADGDNPTLTWQSEVLAPGPQMSGGGGMGMGGQTLPTSGDLTSSALFEQLLKQAQAIASGQSNGASVLDTQALVNLLLGGK